MRVFAYAAAAAAALASLAQPAFAAQPVIPTPAATATLPIVLYEIDYATAGRIKGPGVVDTIVSLGLPNRPLATNCPIQVAWFDWNGAPRGVSGPVNLTPGLTFEFTTSVNLGNPLEYPPYQENVFRSSRVPFEGYAQIRTNDTCPSTLKLRTDAEFATLTVPATGAPGVVAFKPITITNRTGTTGY